MNTHRIYMPPPSNWQDFQTLVGDVARFKYIPESVQEYGRLGQKQNGVDVIAESINGDIIGFQCKETKKVAITTKVVDIEIEKAKNFVPKLSVFFIVTTSPRDIHLQNHCIKLNENGGLGFKVYIRFWDDMIDDINRSRALLVSSYSYYLEEFGSREKEAHLYAIAQAFNRPAFTDDFLHERNIIDFESALVDTKALLRTGYLYDRFGKNLVLQTIPLSAIGCMEYKAFVDEVDKKIEVIYQAVLKDKKLLQKNPRQFDERAGEYNIKRRGLMRKINKMLNDNHMQKIELYY
ncbi:hypothetical protein QMS78_17705 [Cronobacter dublinensis]|uniref:hypothetical protein n=1 Tax=Cronobacter dublinensis TaxID=413497 RepID=UPI0024C30205|nr:hypothetical protein [Cronobacter dublinensis]MDK1254324.1 hypothetical protein [Cronobacter dublinensis]